jgi:predicted enzyme related to lactoylglutathione lyase
MFRYGLGCTQGSIDGCLPMSVLINIDVPDLEAALAFYMRAFGLMVRRRFGGQGAELAGWPVSLFLLQKAAGTKGAGNALRTYERHWTPVHLDVVVDDIDAAITRAVAAGARVEHEVKAAIWGKIAQLADPFGHGICLIQFLGRGYDEIADG